MSLGGDETLLESMRQYYKQKTPSQKQTGFGAGKRWNPEGGIVPIGGFRPIRPIKGGEAPTEQQLLEELKVETPSYLLKVETPSYLDVEVYRRSGMASQN